MNKDLIEFYNGEKNRIQKEIDDLCEIGEKSPLKSFKMIKRINRLVEIEYILKGLYADKMIDELKEK